MRRARWPRIGALGASVLLFGLALSACGGDDFENEPRPAVPIVITGVITPQQVDISPNRFGAGPIALTISNQTPESHRVTLEGVSDDATEISEVTGPINPQDTATIQQNLPPGGYRVDANSEGSGAQITPGRITVGPPRPNASDELELP